MLCTQATKTELYYQRPKLVIIYSYNRKILCLEVSSSNNDPDIIMKYYLDFVRQIGGTLLVIRAD